MPVYQKPQLYDLQFLRYRAWWTEIGNFLLFLHPPPPKNPKYQNFEKMKKKKKKNAGDIIILHMCTKNQNHNVQFMRLGMTQTIFLSLWAIFCPFTSLTTWKIKILKKWNKWLEVSSFYKHVPKITIIWCMLDVCLISDVWCRQIFLSFWTIFPL